MVASKTRILGTNFRWVVPKLDSEIWSKKDQFKTDLLDKLMASKTAKKGIKYYSIAIESHADGTPHLDLLLVFQKRIALQPTELDFLCNKHGNLTRYRTLNQAILEYGSKEDTPLTNLENVQYILNEQDIKKEPIAFLMKQVDKDPFRFDFIQYCLDNNHFTTIQRWSYVKNKIKDYQQGLCNKLLKSKPGIRKIDDELIRSTLTTSELELFHSWSGYQTIVDKINDIGIFKSNRPFKSKQLLLVGPPDTGKTSLINKLQPHIPIYPMGVSNWFPRYASNTYRAIAWNQFRLNLMPYPQLLQFLEGTYMDLPYKGGSTLKWDNPIVIMTSNISLKNHLTKKFKSDQILLKAALQNAPARIDEVILPEYKDLFFLQKLILPLT